MKTINGKIFNFDEVPAQWKLCFCEGCQQHAECMRYQAGQNVPDDVTWGQAVYPSAYKNGTCRHFRPIRVIRGAYGFNHLFADVKQKHDATLRQALKDYLGGHGTYYRYQSGKRLLSPEQQQHILRLFASYGYTDGLDFDHYRDVPDFS